MRYDALITTEAGLITGSLFQVPNRWFLPEGLYQTSCDSSNMTHVGAGLNLIQGSSIGTDFKSALGSTIGEFCERYCAAHQPAGKMKVATYAELVAELGPAAVLAPDGYPLFAPWQYAQPGFPVRPLTAADTVAWVQGRHLLTDAPLWVPAFLVYLPHHGPRYDKGVRYTLNTSTGIATGRTVAEAVQGGFLECAERHAFCTFWYKQLTLDPVPVYTQQTIVREYPDNAWIRRLYDNPRVRLRVFDLGGLGPVETVVVFLHYRYKNRECLSMGAASRFDKASALIKAALEAYQGVEYGIMLDKKEADWTENAPGFTNVDDFHKHFLFYNRFPELRAQVPVLREAFATTPGDAVHHFPAAGRLHSLADLPLAGLAQPVAVDLTTPDVRDMGLHVLRVLTPGWAYLTGMHEQPFLGAPVFGDTPTELFTQLPHPFP